MKFSVNLDFVYNGYDYIEAIREIKETGFEHIEICFMKEKNIDLLERVQRETGIGITLMLSDFVNLTDQNSQKIFIEAIRHKIVQAKRLGCHQIIIAAGDNLEGVSHEKQLASIEDGVIAMLPMFEKENMVMLLEPINNKIDHKETGLWSSKESFAMARNISSPHVRVLYDIYHMQIMGDDVTQTILHNLDLIVHLHCAGYPGRCEPFIGEINYKEIIKLVQEAGYTGGIGIEYTPTMKPGEGLQRIRAMWAEFM